MQKASKSTTKINWATGHGKHADIGGFVYAEGLFHLFLVEKSGIFWVLQHYTSQDNITWEKSKPIAKSLYRLGVGSAIIRGGKLYVAYTAGILGECYIAISKNSIDFTTVDLPIVANKLFSTKYTTPRIIFSHNSYYILATNTQKAGEVAVFNSQGGVNWNYQFAFNVGFKHKYLSIFSLNGICFLLCQKQDGTVCFSRVQVDLSTSKLNFVGEWSILSDISNPRTAVLPDGRVMLFGLADKKGVLSTPRELFCQDDTIAMQPIKELFPKRAEGYCMELGQESGNSIAIASGIDVELELDQVGNSQMTAKIAGKSASTEICIGKNSVRYAGKDCVLDSDCYNARMLISGSKIQIFISGGKQVLSTVLAEKCISLTLKGNGKITYYNLNI